MAIPNHVKKMRSYFAGLIASVGPIRVDTAILDYTLSTSDENYATPSRACTYNSGADTVKTGGAGVFAGLIVGNERVPSNGGESWYSTGDTIELMQMGEIAVNFDDEDGTHGAPAVGGKVYFDPTSGKIRASDTGGMTEIKGAYITKIGVTADPQLAVITLTGPVA